MLTYTPSPRTVLLSALMLLTQHPTRVIDPLLTTALHQLHRLQQHFRPEILHTTCHEVVLEDIEGHPSTTTNHYYNQPQLFHNYTMTTRTPASAIDERLELEYLQQLGPAHPPRGGHGGITMITLGRIDRI